jgi:hypothetical protein
MFAKLLCGGGEIAGAASYVYAGVSDNFDTQGVPPRTSDGGWRRGESQSVLGANSARDFAEGIGERI